MKYTKYFDFGLTNRQTGETETSGVLVIEADQIGDRMYTNSRVRTTLESTLGCLNSLNSAMNGGLYLLLASDVIEGGETHIKKSISEESGEFQISDFDMDDYPVFVFEMAQKD